jgi:hypothetical protein
VVRSLWDCARRFFEGSAWSGLGCDPFAAARSFERRDGVEGIINIDPQRLEGGLDSFLLAPAPPRADS